VRASFPFFRLNTRGVTNKQAKVTVTEISLVERD
jgi:hypothetical protein